MAAIQHITHNGVPQRQHVHAQLVRAARVRVQQHTRGAVCVARDHLIVGERRLAQRGVNFAQWACRPVGGNAQVNLPCIVGKMAVHYGGVSFVNGAGFKQAAKGTLHSRATRHQHQARGGKV